MITLPESLLARFFFESEAEIHTCPTGTLATCTMYISQACRALPCCCGCVAAAPLPSAQCHPLPSSPAQICQALHIHQCHTVIMAKQLAKNCCSCFVFSCVVTPSSPKISVLRVCWKFHALHWFFLCFFGFLETWEMPGPSGPESDDCLMNYYYHIF